MNDEFESRLDDVRGRIAAACERSGRNESEVTLVAVGKKHSPDEVSVAAGLGVTIIGENKIQEAKAKIPLCSDTLEWHFIGHLQSNKVKEAVRLFSMIHSVDSEKILMAINDESCEAGKVMPVCLQVNVSGESSKYGFSPSEIPAVLKKCESLMNVDVAGLMTMPPATADVETVRPYFRQLRELRDTWSIESSFPLTELSMGMSNDFEVAIEEGATLIRLGTLLFGGRS